MPLDELSSVTVLLVLALLGYTLEEAADQKMLLFPAIMPDPEHPNLLRMVEQRLFPSAFRCLERMTTGVDLRVGDSRDAASTNVQTMTAAELGVVGCEDRKSVV